MLDAAFVDWINELNERGFDETFLVLLRAQGFYDIHFTHGPYEFGKDFIAKREEPSPTQYSFQSKAGDIGGSEWTAMLGQLEELIGTHLTHPNFDKTLPRKFVLVTTGRLKGKAVIGPTDFKERLEQSGRGTFECWEQETLLELLHGSARFPMRPSAGLEPIVARIIAGHSSDRDLESVTVQLIPTAGADKKMICRSLIDAYVCSAESLRLGRPFHAITAALAAIRTACVVAHRSRAFVEVLRTSLDELVCIGQVAVEKLVATAKDADGWLRELGGGGGAFLSYPVSCMKTLEYLGLAALHSETSGAEDRRIQCIQSIEDILANQPGACRPISDRFAASLAPPIAALSRAGRQASVDRLIRETAKWLCDIYERSEFGLSSPYATPDEEARCLLGAPFEGPALQRRRESSVAVALLDAAYVFAPALYADVLNDVLAAGIAPTAVHAQDDPAAYQVRGSTGTLGLVNINYPAAAGSSLLAHHAIQSTPRVPETMGGGVVPLALACLLRDRLFTDCLPRLRPATPP